MLVYFALALSIIMTVNFIVFQTLRDGVLSFVLKMFASVCFIVLGIAGYATSVGMGLGSSTIGLLMLGGACFGMVGDGVLALRELEDKRDFFITLCGMIAFAIGHIFYYTALILLAGFSFLPLVIGAIITSLIMIVSTLVMKLNFEKLFIPTIVYAFMLATTMVQAIYVAIVLGGSLASILLAVGFVLFLLSDLVLSLIYFIPQNRGDKKLYVINYTLYYLAQILIMFAIFFL